MADDGHRMGDGRMDMHGYWSDEMDGQGRAGHVCGRERNYQGMCTHVRSRRARGGARIGGGGTGTGTGGSNGSICWAMSVRKLLHNKQENRKKKTVADTSTEVSVASTLSATRLPLPFTFLLFFLLFCTKQIVFALGPEAGLVLVHGPRGARTKARTHVGRLTPPHPSPSVVLAAKRPPPAIRIST